MDRQVKQNQPILENLGPGKIETTTTRNNFDELFDRNWEVFVIKLDEKTGKFIGKVACCAHQPV